jgi:hypothetical protein
MPPKKDPLARLPVPTDSISELPFETSELRRLLEKFLNTLVDNPLTKKKIKIGNFKWGVYAFYDYDGEPIYVGQTKESLRTRIRRHLTNQRTDAVAMNVLDPFEVYKIIVYPLPHLQIDSAKNVSAKQKLDALERKVYEQAIADSKFSAILNEKEPPVATVEVEVPEKFECVIVSEAVKKIREHPDIRVARRTQTISRLAQVIAERKVQKGLRSVLLIQAKRLEWLAQRRLQNAADVPESEADWVPKKEED